MLQTIDKTGVVYQNPSCKLVRKKLSKGQALPTHNHPGEDVLISVVSGSVSGKLAGEAFALTAGDLVRFDGALMVDLEATSDGTEFLVYVVKKNG
ncbi:cupin domain-containing protein [Deinococcus cellulosilyticus]|uniref:Cupin type-2 domain-containing protein n=1 Tax=Deinococcus cellulosilyticus (strain DSM 18568 / NBRC 106333 / KACC 11606 / 5516J-15) TaxID=1223518 RepID=A0A511N2R9_DEIC1|nr:cupin domain-containing protein [Deinococcus cellulosilyticus]GEM47150.1 hypothetical protein DC3_27850 [Deinococcus cellulosilyticus NBRC 106333 = KACC 11606]